MWLEGPIDVEMNVDRMLKEMRHEMRWRYQMGNVLAGLRWKVEAKEEVGSNRIKIAYEIFEWFASVILS